MKRGIVSILLLFILSISIFGVELTETGGVIDIKFASGSDKITEESFGVLNSIAEEMKLSKYDGKYFLIEGHSDKVGNEQLNYEISKKRAESVRDYFVMNSGIDKDRFIIRYYGFSRPIDTADTLEAYAKNRRVVIKLQKTKEIAETKDITNVSVVGIKAESIEIKNNNIDIVVPKGTDLKNLILDIKNNGIRVMPSSSTMKDYTSPVTYTVVAADDSKKDYTIVVKEKTESIMATTNEIPKKQKMVKAVNQLIPYYLNDAKNKGSNWLKSTSINVQFDNEWDTVYWVETVQPIGKINKNGNLLFVQGDYNYVTDKNKYSNIGLGIRNLSKDKTRVMGLNIFSDKEYQYNLSRLGLGFEFFKNLTEFRGNYYYPTSNDKIIERTESNLGYSTTYIRAVEGFDYSMSLLNRKLPWAKVGLIGSYWNNKHSEDEKNYKINTTLQITPRISTELYYQDSNMLDTNYGVAISYKLADGFISSLIKNRWFDTRDLSNKMLEKVERNNVIKTETYTKFTPYQGSIKLTVDNKGTSLAGAKLQAYQNGSPVGASVLTGADGVATLTNLNVGTYTVKSTYFSNEVSSTDLVVTKDNTTENSLSFNIVVGKITVNVLDNSANKLIGAKVTATLVSGSSNNMSRISKMVSQEFSLEATTDANGGAVFANLPPGTYTFKIENTTGAISENSSDVTIESGGDKKVNVVLPSVTEDTSTKGTIFVEVKHTSGTIISRASVAIKQGEATIKTAETNEEGIAVFSAEAGDYTVEITKEGYGKKTINSFAVTANKTISILENTMIKIISNPVIGGLTAPTTGEIAVTTITATDEYTGTVTWSPALVDGKFESNTTYEATIILTAKAGYTLNEINENFFTVEGATATNDVNSGEISVSNFAKTAKTIENPNILGLIAPIRGEVPVTTITETAEYTGTVTWSPALVDGKFAGNTIYTATVTLTTKTGYTASGVSENFFKVTGATATNSANNKIINVEFSVTDKNPITKSAITGVISPKAGETAVTTITETAEYTGTVTWSPALVGGKFANDTNYSATITITPTNDYKLEGITENFFTVTGATATNSANNGTINVSNFPKTDKKVTVQNITGLTAPVRGETAVTTITETAEYTGTVTWSPALVDGKFAGNTIYTATVILSEKSGFTFGGISSNFFTVAGATATNSANSGTITVTFPQTAKNPFTINSITGLAQPVAGATAVTTITPTAEYIGTITWSPALVGGKFFGEESYTATVTLTAKTGYTATGVSSNFYTVANATEVTNNANSGVITVKFPETNKLPVTTKSLTGLVQPVAGATAGTGIVVSTADYTGTVTWSPALESGKFARSTIYTATVTLTEKKGYTFDNVASDFFVVPGATEVKNVANTRTVTVKFPQTAALAPITVKDITGLTLPVRGDTPDKIIDETEEYTVNIEWNNNPSTFAGGNIYYATLTIVPKAGYTLDGISSNFFKVSGATRVTNSANSGTVTVTFPKTEVLLHVRGYFTKGGVETKYATFDRWDEFDTDYETSNADAVQGKDGIIYLRGSYWEFIIYEGATIIYRATSPTSEVTGIYTTDHDVKGKGTFSVIE